MLHHHKVLTEGTQTQGVVISTEASAEEGFRKLFIGVRFEDGSETHFEHRIRDYFEPPRHLTENLGLPEKHPVIPLWFSSGDMIPVRFDPKDRTKLVIDEPALENAALQKYIDGERRRIAAAEAKLQGPMPGL